MRQRRTYWLWTACLGLFFISCEEHSHNGEHSQHPKKDTASTMSGMENMPGMDHANHGKADHSNMLILSAREQLLAGIQTDTVRPGDFQQSVTALGVVAVDESSISVITAKVSGRIDKMYVRNPGETVRAGQPLYELYSETLLAEQQDLIHLIQNNASKELIEAARQKLKLHGITQDQLSGIEQQRSASATLTIYNPSAGYLSNLPAREGQYVETGDVLFEIASLDVVRVNAQVYPGEISAFNKASSYSVVSGANEIYTATKTYDNPALEPGTKILYVRLRVTNKEHRLRPGMMTTVKAISGSEKLLTIPKASVLEENGMQFTWVREADGMFNRRMIRTGRGNENGVEIIEGLQEGDCVVTSGIYLLNSEYILRKGGNSMGGMKM